MARKRQQASPRRRSEKKRYLVFTEGEVTEKQYLELLQQQIRSKIATFKTITVGGEPTKVWKSVEDMLNNNRRGSKDDKRMITSMTLLFLSLMLTNTNDYKK